MLLKNWKALFIDLDGTLIDSIPLLYQTYLEFMESKGEKGSLEEFATLNGKAFPEIFRYLKETYGFEEEEAELAGHYHQRVISRYQGESKLFPYAQQTLQRAQAQGKKLFLVTSAPLRLAQQMLERLEVASYFHTVISAELVGQSKPHPAIYLHALVEAHLKAQEGIAIEDSYHGVCSAVGAGIPTLAYGVAHHRGELATVANWLEIQKLLGLEA